MKAVVGIVGPAVLVQGLVSALVLAFHPAVVGDHVPVPLVARGGHSLERVEAVYEHAIGHAEILVRVELLGVGVAVGDPELQDREAPGSG